MATKSLYERVAKGIAIYKPNKSRFFWARIAIADHPSIKEIRQSLKTEDRDKAIEAAWRLKFRTEARQEEALDILPRKPLVHQVAEQAARDIEQKKPFKTTYTAYIRVLRARIAPYFQEKATRIDSLNSTAIDQYFKERPINSTTQININKTAFRYIFRKALELKVLQERDIPKSLPRVERQVDEVIRDYLTKQEEALLFNNIDKFISQSRKHITLVNRFLLREAIRLLLGSGCRPGQEIEALKWGDIKREKGKGSRYIFTAVIKNGKTGKQKRAIVLDTTAVIALKNLLYYLENNTFMEVDYNTNINLIDFGQTFEFLSQKYADKTLFSRLDGQTPDLTKTFEQFLAFLRKETGKFNSQITLYSMRKTYITRKLIDYKASIHTIARQVGNSSAMVDKYYSKLKALDKYQEFTDYEMEAFSD